MGWAGVHTDAESSKKIPQASPPSHTTETRHGGLQGEIHTRASASPAPFPLSAQQQQQRKCISPADSQATPQKAEERACGGTEAAVSTLFPTRAPLPFPPPHTNAHRYRYAYTATRTLA